LKDWSVRGAERKDRTAEVKLESSESEAGTSNVWSIPVVEKNERLEVSFEIKGEGEVDAEVLNQFHGVTFGDEVEDDMPASSTPEEPSTESSDDSSESSDEPGAGFKWREDVLLRVMSEHGIDESMRDDFVRHAVKFDNDDNLYLKKAEIIAAAEAWESSSEEETAEEAPAEEAPVEEAPVEESPAEEAPAEESPAEEAPVEESKDCPICGASNSSDATTCESCGFSF
jgi:hypothetical protein